MPEILSQLDVALLVFTAFILLLQWGPKLRFAAKGKAALVVAGFAGTHFGLRKMMKLPEDEFRFWFRWLITLLSLRMLALGLLELFSA